MADQPAPPPARKSIFKMFFGGFLGLCTGALAMYSQVVFDMVAKPPKPLANFSNAGIEGLTANFENAASGQSGWWDFGDGTALEPFDANQPKVSHTYAKPGTYSVKLAVKNFLREEADRSVSVDLSTPPPPPSTLPPTITGLKVQPINETAPATYLITGQMANADEVVWKYGDKAEHVVAPAGAFEKYITIATPGDHPIVLTALSKSKKDPLVLVQPVRVTAPVKDNYDALITVSDAATRMERLPRTVYTPAAVMEQGKPTRGVDKTISAIANSTIVEAKIDPKLVPMVKNLKVEIAKDGKTARVTGEWAATAEKSLKAGGGGDVSLPVAVVEERPVPMAGKRNTYSGVWDASGQILVALSQQPQTLAVVNATRTIDVDFGITYKDGRRRDSLAKGTLDAAGAWSAPVKINDKMYTVKANAANGTVRVVFQ